VVEGFWNFRVARVGGGIEDWGSREVDRRV